MAKKSARAKGYRKYHKEVKGYTPQEKKVMTIGFIALVVIIICVLVVPDFIESFSLLKVKDGVVQDMGDNWLIANTGTSSKPKYHKMAEFGGVEGYELSSTEDGITDTNVRYYVYTPTVEGAAADKLNVQSGNGEASELSETFRTQMTAFGEVLTQSEAVEETEINGMKTYTVTMEYRSQDYNQALAFSEAQGAADAATAAGEEIPEDVAAVLAEEPIYEYYQTVVLYIDSNIDGKCIVLNATNTCESEADFRDLGAMVDFVKQAAASITLAD